MEDLNSCQISPFIDINAQSGQVKFFVDFSLTKFKVKLITLYGKFFELLF